MKNILDNMKMEITDSLIAGVTCNCEEINTLLKNYGQDIKNIENDITSIKGQISTINTTQNTFRTDLTNLTGRVNSLETNLTNLTSKVTTIENNYATKATTTLLDNKITNLTATVNSINTNLTNLTNRVNALAQQELTIYMSPSGNDSNDGLSSSKPMKTLNSVLNKYSNPSLMIQLADGTYDWGNVIINNRYVTIQSVSYTPDSTVCDYYNCNANVSLDGMTFNNSYISFKGIHFLITSNVKIEFNNSTSYMDRANFDDPDNYQYERHVSFELNNSYLNANRFKVHASSGKMITAGHNSSVILKDAYLWNNSYNVFSDAHILQATENSSITVENVFFL